MKIYSLKNNTTKITYNRTQTKKNEPIKDRGQNRMYFELSENLAQTRAAYLNVTDSIRLASAIFFCQIHSQRRVRLQHAKQFFNVFPIGIFVIISKLVAP